MDEKRLRKLIKELQTEITKAQDVDEKGKALLGEIMNDSRDFLAGASSGATGVS